MEAKRLYRSGSNKVLCGVCGGLGEYLNLDPTVVRLLFLVLGFPFHGLVLYLIAAWIMPQR